jgi:hypothetical protein
LKNFYHGEHGAHATKQIPWGGENQVFRLSAVNAVHAVVNRF